MAKKVLNQSVIVAYMDLVELFKAEANKQGISIEELATKADIPRTVFYQTKNFTIFEIFKICEVLGIDTVNLNFK